MKKILMSINPHHVDNIIKGIKKYEYRTRVAKQKADILLIYCTCPIKKVVAEVQIKRILTDTPEKLWEKTKEDSGINKCFYDQYFESCDLAYAYELGEVKKYDKPKELIEFGCMHAPQSFVYVTK